MAERDDLEWIKELRSRGNPAGIFAHWPKPEPRDVDWVDVTFCRSMDVLSGAFAVALLASSYDSEVGWSIVWVTLLVFAQVARWVVVRELEG